MKKWVTLVLTILFMGIFTSLTAQGPVFRIRLYDTDNSHYLSFVWNENEASANRILNWVMNGSDRTIDLTGNFTLSGNNKVATWEATSWIGLRSNAELRFYDNGNYVGFEAPALSADQIWVLPNADGSNLDVLRTDGAGNLSWATAASGVVSTVQYSIQVADAASGWVEDTGFKVNSGTVIAGTWQGTAIDISSYTNLAVDSNELTLTGDSLGLANHATARSALGLGTSDDPQFNTIKLNDSNDSNTLQLIWGENDTADRTLTYSVYGGDRQIILYENFTLGNGYDGILTYTGSGKTLSVEDTAVVSQDYSSDANVQFAQVTVGATGLIVGSSTPFSDSSGTLTLQNIDALGATTESTIEAAIDTLANLTSVQGHTLTLAGNLVTQNNNVTINAVTAARTLTMNENLTIGDGNDGTLTYSGASKTLTVADDCTVNQSVQTTSDVQHADLYLTDCIGQDFYDEGSENSAFTIDWNNSNFQKVTITGAALDITFTEPPHAGRYLLMIIQGDGNDTLDWEHEVSPKWPGNVEPTLSTGAGDIDIIVFFFDGSTTYYGLASLNFE